MIEKIKTFIKTELIDNLRDVRVIGLLTFLLIVLMMSYSGIKVIEANYKLQKQIAQLQQENKVQQLKNNNLKLQKDYYNTDQYLEIFARQNFGLAGAGEKELTVPKDVALARAPQIKTGPPTETAAAEANQPFFVRNFHAWREFFGGQSVN
ncbi:MAG: hypothetical protein JWM37_64 [Candidatus Saccharibacteria bacterium]|nr:hypothetical protein [Candidatus Saccharibacteria bacterium]